MHQNEFANIAQLEADLWSAADNLRANSKLTAGEYCMPVLGIIFLAHATNRYKAALKQIQADQVAGKMAKRPLKMADFKSRRALMLPKEAQFDELVNLPKGVDLGAALVAAMDAIERDFEPLSGQLPRDYTKFESNLLEDILRVFDSETLRTASGDVFGRINEYFLMKFAMQGAQDNGEFFTPPSLVQTIVNVIEPSHGIVLDPAFGSGGMAVQTGHFIEQQGKQVSHEVTFYGLEYKTSNLRLAKMNLAVHGLEGDVVEANTFYTDSHELLGKCDFVMANPPFNVDMVDAEKVKTDPRLPFGLPGITKGKKAEKAQPGDQKKKDTVSNGNYLWISYFWSYLNETGRAGFVMSSQASSAGHGEAEVRRKLVETGDVDVMISIRSNFFYTRTVPCELWFFDKGKPKSRRDQVLMIDARNIFRKVTRKIYDFTPEQLKNLTSIVWLYRGETDRFVSLVQQYLERALSDAAGIAEKTAGLQTAYEEVEEATAPLLKSILPSPSGRGAGGEGSGLHDLIKDRDDAAKELFEELSELHQQIVKRWKKPCAPKLGPQKKLLGELDELATACREFVKSVDLLFKLTTRVIDTAEKDFNAKDHQNWDTRAIARLEKALDAQRLQLVEQLKSASYFERQAHWLLSRFPDGKLVDVPGLVKLVDRKDIASAEWSLTPGRYVEVAPAEVDEDFDFQQAITDIHIELADLNKEAASLAKRIQRNFEGLGL